MKRPPSILTERGFDRRLAAAIVVAFVAHLLFLGIVVMLGEYRLRPRTQGEAYTVEILEDGELGGHMPKGLPELDVGGREPRKPTRMAKQVPRPEPPRTKPKPPEPPRAKPEPPEPQPRKPAKAPPAAAVPPVTRPPSEDDLIVATAVPTPRPTPVPTARPTAAPTARPTPEPTAAPTVAPTARPTAKPTARPTAKPTPRPTAKPTARPTARPQPTAKAAERPQATAARGPAPRPKAASSPHIVVRAEPTPGRGAESAPPATGSARDARIADALERVQRRVGGGRPEEAAGGARAPASGRAGSAASGVGGTDAPEAGRGIGIGPGRGGAGQVRGTEFLLYYNEMLERIREAWVYTGAASEIEVTVRFRILEGGEISDLRVTQPSGNAAYDASVIRAVRAVSPLRPPPEKYRRDFSDVELVFQPGDLQVNP